MQTKAILILYVIPARVNFNKENNYNKFWEEMLERMYEKDPLVIDGRAIN